MKVCVLDYENVEVRILSCEDNMTCEDVELMLVEQYEYSLNAIEYMLVPSIKGNELFIRLD